MNEANLSPRVPQAWLLERQEGRSLEIPEENLRRFKPPSSQRCAASGFSAHLQVTSTPFGDRFAAVKEPKEAFSSSQKSWWSLRGSADVGPRWYGS